MQESNVIIPFDKDQFNARLKSKKINRSDLICHSSITFTSMQLRYYERQGMIPKNYYEEIEAALSDEELKGSNKVGQKYYGSLVDFGYSEFYDLKNRCKKLNVTLTDVCTLNHLSYTTLLRYKKERHIPSDALAKINRKLDEIEIQNSYKSVQDPETKTEEYMAEQSLYQKDINEVADTITMVMRCNGEANLNLSNIQERYGCDTETFVNAVFYLVSNNGCAIYTTYNNEKPSFSLGESI